MKHTKTKKIEEYKEIPYKSGSERNKRIWILKNPEGKVVGRFRSLVVAKAEKKEREKFYWGVNLILERDNSYRENLKENLKKKKK